MRIIRPDKDPDEPDRRPAIRNERFAGDRDLTYEEMFGNVAHVLHEMDQRHPHIDVYLFTPRKRKREFYTMATSGMSDFKMATPAPVGDGFSRAELVFYCRDPKFEYANMLREIAHYPHEEGTWLGPRHTLQFGKLLDMDGDGHRFAGYLFLPPPYPDEKNLPELLKLDGTPVHFLWVIPLTAAELDLAQKEGTEAVLHLLSEHNAPPVFAPNRPSYA